MTTNINGTDYIKCLYGLYNSHVRLHLTEASSEWTQLWTPRPLLVQSMRRDSVPVQATLSRTIGPVPGPKRAKLKA